LDYAKYWRSDAGAAVIEDLLKMINESQRVVGSENVVLVFPGLAAEFSTSLQDILSKALVPVIGMTAFPPTASGQILYEVLKQKFRELGGELLLVGSGVKQVKLQGKRCQKVIVQSKGRSSEFSARSFVLATGGIFGGGINVTPKVKQETVLGLPLFIPSKWTRSEFLGEQPYARMGIEVDCELRPIKSQNQEVILENVRVVGRMLAHWDPWVEHCGGGVSLASGWFAGEKM
ncbi:MAG: anaerobic glycerol-3-phosphate dehydrogenase subunit B, partial [Bacillota bacterium]|nr:anaerobic glycerol-3-phosphate dehydrogenase subunit B [Bacillota bacterium]